MRQTVPLLLGITASLGVASAADLPVKGSLANGLMVSGSVGHLSGMAHEYVYVDGVQKLSELDWDMEHALVLNGGLTYDAADRLRLYGNLSVGLSGDNAMDDYDWLGAPPPADPDMHSWHPDTELDHYYMIDAGASFLLTSGGPHELSVLGGFKYTDIQWTAYGGCYDYPYYDVSGCIADGAKVITYRQSLPALYGGLGYQGTFDRWSLGLEGRAGFSMASAEDDDDHWLRDLNLRSDFNSAPYVGINGRVSYAVREGLELIGSVAYDKFFEMKGSKTYTDTSTGEAQTYDDASGASLYTLNASLGFGYRF